MGDVYARSCACAKEILTRNTIIVVRTDQIEFIEALPRDYSKFLPPIIVTNGFFFDYLPLRANRRNRNVGSSKRVVMNFPIRTIG